MSDPDNRTFRLGPILALTAMLCGVGTVFLSLRTARINQQVLQRNLEVQRQREMQRQDLERTRRQRGYGW